MSTIPSVNVVVQQGSRALKAQNSQQHPVSPDQHALARAPEKEVAARTTVQQSDDAEKMKFERERSGGKNEREPKKRKGAEEEEEGVKPSADSGRLLDIVV